MFRKKSDISNHTYKTIPDLNGRCQYGTDLRDTLQMTMKDTISVLCEELYYFERLCEVHRIRTKAEFEDILNNYSDKRSHIYQDIRKKVLEDISDEIKENQRNAINMYFESQENIISKNEEQNL